MKNNFINKTPILKRNSKKIISTKGNTFCHILPACKNYFKNGECNLIHNFLHQDCKFYNKYQYCSRFQMNKCQLFHRKICSLWKNKGKCIKENCKFLHKDCEDFHKFNSCAKDLNCPFYHRKKEKKEKNLIMVGSLLKNEKKVKK